MKYWFTNFWWLDEAENYNNVYTRFLKNHTICNNLDEIDVLLVGSFIRTDEDYDNIAKLKCKKILCITEPLTVTMSKLIRENELLFIFGCINECNTVRYKYPLYIDKKIFDYTDKNIYKNVNDYVKTCDIDNKQFCCLISRHDMYGSRTGIFNSLNKIDTIVCPGDLFNNCSNEELNRIGNPEYIKKFMFHICCESVLSETPGYITEKLMNCCVGGAIPIYCGGFDEFDAKIFNKKRILFFNYNSEDSIRIVTKKVVALLKNKMFFELFYQQPIFCDGAYDVIQDLESKLMNRFDNLL